MKWKIYLSSQFVLNKNMIKNKKINQIYKQKKLQTILFYSFTEDSIPFIFFCSFGNWTSRLPGVKTW